MKALIEHQSALVVSPQTSLGPGSYSPNIASLEEQEMQLLAALQWEELLSIPARIRSYVINSFISFL